MMQETAQKRGGATEATDVCVMETSKQLTTRWRYNLQQSAVLRMEKYLRLQAVYREAC